MSSVFVLLFLRHCFIFLAVLSLCCAYRSSLYCNIPSDLCTLCLSCYFCDIVSSLYLCCCHVVHTDDHFTVIYRQTCVLCVCPVISATLFIIIPVLLSCCVYRSSLYCYIPSHMCNLCCSCYYFYIVLSLWLYCCYVVYTQHNNNTNIKIKQCRSNNKTNTEYTSLKVYYSKVMICIHNMTTAQV